jgi:hypothetical protein
VGAFGNDVFFIAFFKIEDSISAELYSSPPPPPYSVCLCGMESSPGNWKDNV